MANKVRDSFDWYGAVAEMAGVWDTGGSCTLRSNSRFGVGQSITNGQTLNQVGFSKTFASVTSATIFVSFSHMMTTAPAGSTVAQEIRLWDGASVQMCIAFTEGGSILFRRGNGTTTVATYSGAFAGNSEWNRFECKIVLNDTTGSVEVRKNGNSIADFSATGLDTLNTANARADLVDIICRNSATALQYIDDFWVYDDTAVTGEASGFLGDLRAVQVMPTSDQAVQWTPNAGATNYTQVDELINSTADYVSSTVPGNVDLYGSAGLPATPQTIHGVSVRAILLKTDAGARTAALRLKSGSTTVTGANITTNVAARSAAYEVNQNPDTSTAWNATTIAAAQFGPRDVA